MSLRLALYSALLFVLIPLALARLAWRARQQPGYVRNLGERFGRYRSAPQHNVLWVHAVSVGETRAAEPLVRALQAAYPSHRVLLTTMTPTGRQTSEQLFGDTVLRCQLPYDLPFAVAAFLRHYRPLFGALMETELWPNLVEGCRAAGVPVALVNARLSERSARGYRRVGGLMRETLERLTAVGAQSQADADRLSGLGAARVTVTGNLKFDRGPKPADHTLGAMLRARFGARPVLVAASTREGEEELVLDAVADAPPELLTVIVPRHLQRFDEVARLIERRGLAFQRRSDELPVRAQTRVLLGDSMGELFAYYAASDMAFIGGSLLPLGGQNLLEACAAGKPVLIGPHPFNFAEATRLAVEAGAALQVADVGALAEAVRTLLADAPLRNRMGAAGLALMRQHQGATQRTLALLQGMLAESAGARP
jgi:3-deoxy-D-manno-octulosonic-acid transferase